MSRAELERADRDAVRQNGDHRSLRWPLNDQRAQAIGNLDGVN